MSQLLQELLSKLTGGPLLCRLQLLQATKAIKAMKVTKATEATEAAMSDCCILRAANVLERTAAADATPTVFNDS